MSILDLLLPPGCLACGAWTPGPPRFLCASCATRVRPPEPPLCRRCGGPAPTAMPGSVPGLVRGWVSDATPDSRPGAPRDAAPGSIPGPLGEDTCPACVDWPQALGQVRSAALLQPPADDLAHALKYGGWPEAAEEMARGMASLLPPGSGVLVPIPTTRRRLRRRGYNQAERLARALASKVPGWEVRELLLRPGEGGSQVALHREERMANVSGAFTLHPGASLEGLGCGPLVLVDDVLTTGATAAAAAQVLAGCGPGVVHLVTYGRALPGEGGRDPSRPLPPGFFSTWLRTGRRPRHAG
jgi:predicted amidophosphoribosyltransferase